MNTQQEEAKAFTEMYEAMQKKKTQISNYEYTADVEDFYIGPIIVKGLFPTKEGKFEHEPKKASDERFASIQSKFLSIKIILPIGTKLPDGQIIQTGYQVPFKKAIYQAQMPDLYEELLSFTEEEITFNHDLKTFIGTASGYTINSVHIAKIRTHVPFYVKQEISGTIQHVTDRFNNKSTATFFTMIAIGREDIQGMGRKQLGIIYNEKLFVAASPNAETAPAETIPDTKQNEKAA